MKRESRASDLAELMAFLKEPVICARNCVTSISRAVSHWRPRQYVTTGISKLRGISWNRRKIIEPERPQIFTASGELQINITCDGYKTCSGSS